MTQRPPKVSVGLPVYNGENYLRAAVDAILAQTFADVELVISDNASTDGTQAICQEYAARDGRVRYHRAEQNRGVAWNFNRVLELARGEYFCWAAHDDLWRPTFLERCVEPLDRDPTLVLCAPKAAVIDERGDLVPERSNEELRRQPADRLTDEVDPVRFDFLGSPQPHRRFCGVLLHSIRCYEEFGLIRRAVLRGTGPRPAQCGAEKVLLAKLSLLGRWQQVPEVLFFSRWHPQRFSSLATAKEQNQIVNPQGRRWPGLPRSVRCTLAYLLLIPRAPIAWSERLRCFAVWMQFVLRWQKWKKAFRDLFRGAGMTAVLKRPAEQERASTPETVLPANMQRDSMTEPRTILITGGSGGIGSALARRCAAVGARPVIGYCSRVDLALRVQQECGCGETLHLDLRRSDFGCGGRLPRVDAVVHNAALFLPGRSLLESSDEELRSLMEVNLFGPLRLTRALLAAGNHLRDVLFVLSTASFGRGTGPYALSKVGELAVCKLLVGELAARGTRVNAVAPGWTDTPVAPRAAQGAGLALDEIRARHLDGRILTADEVGQLCARVLLDSPPDFSGHLVVWDRRENRDAVWLRLETVFAADELVWTRPTTLIPHETLDTLIPEGTSCAS